MIRKPDGQSAKTPSTGSAPAAQRSKNEPNPAAPGKDGVQGEGNHAAAREFNEAERKFVESGKVAAAARAAAPTKEPRPAGSGSVAPATTRVARNGYAYTSAARFFFQFSVKKVASSSERERTPMRMPPFLIPVS